jgi:hypothetical protein
LPVLVVTSFAAFVAKASGAAAAADAGEGRKMFGMTEVGEEHRVRNIDINGT